MEVYLHMEGEGMVRSIISSDLDHERDNVWRMYCKREVA